MSQNFIYNLQPSNYPMGSADKLRWLNSPEYWNRSFNGYDYVGNNIRGNYPGVANQPWTVKGYGQTYSAPRPYTTGIGQTPLQGYASTTAEASVNPEVAAEIDNLTKDTGSLVDELEKAGVKGAKNGKPFSWNKVSTYPKWLKIAPIVGDAYDIGRGLYRTSHGQPLGGLAQAGVGTAGLLTLGAGSFGKSLVKSLIKSGLKKAGEEGAISIGKYLAKNNSSELARALLKKYKPLSDAFKTVGKWQDPMHNIWGRLIAEGLVNLGGGDEQSTNQEPNTDNIDWSQTSTFADSPNYDPIAEMYKQYFGDLPEEVTPSFDLDTSTYPSWLNGNNGEGLNNYGLPQKEFVTKDQFIDVLKQYGYTDEAIQDALNGNDNGIPEIKAGIESYNKYALPGQEIKLAEHQVDEQPIIQPLQVESEEVIQPIDGTLFGGVNEDAEPEEDADALEYLQALADIDDVIDKENEEYAPYLEGLANYLKDYDDKYKFYHDMKRYYAAMSGLANNSAYNTVPTGLDPRDNDAVKLDLYKKLADERIALDNRARELKGNIDLAKSLNYPLSSAFANKQLLNSYMNARLADSRIKATQAIAELNNLSKEKIAEMNNRRALEVAKINNLSAMQRVQLQQNESNYRKSLDIKIKQIDLQLKHAHKVGDWQEARKLTQFKEIMSNKRAAVKSLMDYATFGNTSSGMSIYDIVSILGGDINTLMSGLSKKESSNSVEGQLAKDFK